MSNAPRRERKVVTVVFCDLVGFTAQAESLDPEDVEALLGPYHERVRTELERHGGTVEKFIGDAVMALFGAPTAHEDDPERAVRAALAIRDFALEEELELRVGITTGEALVRLDARPDAGEGMASGDVVNTAARLQSAAPVNGILVDETTYRATRQAIEYGAAETVEAKGKAAPVPVWRVDAARSRFGVDVEHHARTELVGRERELGLLRDAFDRARHGRVPQLVTLVGVPGMGKSRLLYELSRFVDAHPELVTWRQGRCLAYGDGVTMWALGEIVKAQVGILEQDSEDVVAEKIRRAVEDVVDGSGDEARITAHLGALAGISGEGELGGDRRNEAFSAWRAFIEAIAEQRPLVLVFEDLHWADEVLLDFVDELVDWVTDVPLLVVATARPELLERRPGWGGGKLNATTLALSPLSDEQTATLLGRLLGRSVLPADSQRALLERAGGNPLYAEQFADLYVERGSADELPLPESLQGIIAARLDSLSQDEKRVLQHGAVVGKVFWASALANGADDVSPTLHSLERKSFLRRQKRSSIEGELEYAFAHALVRDVAYAQIARADRAERHRQVAEWIESLGRPEDHAEMRAYHWSSALELARASGTADTQLEESARLALRAAGDRAFSLNSFATAAARFDDALALWPADDAGRPDLLFRYARALVWAYDEERREQALEAARDALLAAGDAVRAGEAEAFLARVAWDRGQSDLVRTRLQRAKELVGDEASPAAARVLATSARMLIIAEEASHAQEVMVIAESALTMAGELGLAELQAHSLATRGMAKNALEAGSGVDDMEQALELALAADSPVASAIVNNLAVDALVSGDIRRADELYAEAFRLAERFGDAAGMRFIRGNRIWAGYARGRWDDSLADANVFVAACEAGSPHTQEVLVRQVRAEIRHARGDPTGALEDDARALTLAREQANPGALIAGISLRAAMLAELGRTEEARALADELAPVVRDFGPHGSLATVAAVLAEELGLAADLQEALDHGPRRASSWRSVLDSIFAGDLRGGAELLSSMGSQPLAARVRLYAGRSLIARGESEDGVRELEQALAFYRSVGAAYFVERCEALLAPSAQRDSA